MKKLIIVLLALGCTTAFAADPTTDEMKLSVAASLCRQHYVAVGPNKGYATGFEKCPAIMLAVQALQSTKDAQTASHKSQIDDIASRLPK